MGLDNGFVVKGMRREDVPGFVLLPFTDDGKEDLDLCYWRKCWGLRGEINSVLHLPGDMWECDVDREDLPAVMSVLKRYMSPVYWEENANSIWDWDTIFPNLVQSYINLFWLHHYWESHPEIKVWWYDSY